MEQITAVRLLLAQSSPALSLLSLTIDHLSNSIPRTGNEQILKGNLLKNLMLAKFGFFLKMSNKCFGQCK